MASLLAGLPKEMQEALEELLEGYEADQEAESDDWVEPAPDPVTAKRRETLRDELFMHGSEFKPSRRENIVGIDNILGEIEEIIHWLRYSKEYEVHKSRLQPGVIFAGIPGTGKTLVSRWIATDSEALFVNIRDFVHNGALFTDGDIRDLFARARARYAETGDPVVLFWDEFENAAIERSDAKCTPEQRSVVSQLTAELDGVGGKNEGLLLIGCTNYLHSIDEALMRRGRMGVQIEFHPPDRAGKEKILRYYLGQMRTTADIDVHTLSYFFPKDNTAADIEEACVEAWRHAVKRTIDDQKKWPTPLLTTRDLIKVFIKQLVGPPTTFVIPGDERLPIAIHECGHAIVALAYNVPMRLITVQPGKKALGRVMVDDLKEYISTIPENINYMRMGLGGIAAERAAGLDPMTGATHDIKRVTQTAQYLVDNLTAGEATGVLNITAFERKVDYSNMNPQVSAGYLADSDKDIRTLIRRVERDADDVMQGLGSERLLQIATIVNDRVTMTGIEFHELFLDICGFEPETLRPFRKKSSTSGSWK